MAIYCWSIYRPNLLHPILLFTYGVLIDLILSSPLGFHSLVFLISHYFIKSQKSFFLGQPYLIFWLGFAVFLILILLIEWIFFSLVRQGLIEFNSLLFAYVISIFIFPVISWICLTMNKIISRNAEN